MSAPIHADFRRHLHPSMRTSASIHADVRTNPCGRPHRCPQRCPQMSALMSADVRRLPRTSLRTTADLHMEILRTSAQKKFPACVDLRTKRPNTPQTSAGKCPQFSMRNITFFADISGTGIRVLCNPKCVFKPKRLRIQSAKIYMVAERVC